MQIVMGSYKNVQIYYGKPKTIMEIPSPLEQHAMTGKLVHAETIFLLLQRTRTMKPPMNSVITTSCHAERLI